MYQECLEAIARLHDAGAVRALRDSRIGLEKESLRVDLDGHIARTPHPRALGSALTHPYITTDFSEALLEFVTPPFSDSDETLSFLCHVHQFVYQNLDPEILWCASMPCMVSDDAAVPIADYGHSNVGRMKRVYREGLSHRYGRVMQTIAGVHFNYSLPAAVWRALNPGAKGRALQAHINDGYFACVRNFQRFGWLVPYLFGSSPAVCKSFLGAGAADGFEQFDDGTLYLPYATSLRMSDVGYKNSNQSGLAIDYAGVDSYVQSLTRAIETPYPEYEAIGVEADGEYRQLNANLLQIENEYYSFIRPKQITRSGEKPTIALRRRGVRYVEVRALDVNPFEPLGVSEASMYFIEALVVFCTFAASAPVSAEERARIEHNQLEVAMRGRDPALELDTGAGTRPLAAQAVELLDALAPVCAVLDEAHASTRYHDALAQQRAAVADPRLLPSARVLEAMGRDGVPFFRFAMNMSLAHRDWFMNKKMSSAQRRMFVEEAARSLAQQREIEAADSISFEEYLRRYFAQSLDRRESVLR
jgi:glutamate--cysteine ligase